MKECTLVKVEINNTELEEDARYVTTTIDLQYHNDIHYAQIHVYGSPQLAEKIVDMLNNLVKYTKEEKHTFAIDV